MSMSLAECARLLKQRGIRHHVDAEQGLIRLVFVTRQFRNLRDEKMVIVGVEAPDDGRRVRAVISRAFAPGADPAAVCLAACRLAADTPLVAVEFDAECEDLRLVAETAVEDGTLTSAQLVAMIERLVDAAEVWAPALAESCSGLGSKGRTTARRGVA